MRLVVGRSFAEEKLRSSASGVPHPMWADRTNSVSFSRKVVPRRRLRQSLEICVRIDLIFEKKSEGESMLEVRVDDSEERNEVNVESSKP
jgi:hypothetical protein